MIDYKKAVKDLRDKLIMTQAEFANMLGVSFEIIDGRELQEYMTMNKGKICG